MRHAAAWLCLLVPLAAADAAAQHPQFTKDVPGIAEGPAEIRGRIVHPSRASAASGLPVVLYALPADGPPGLRNTESGEDGSFTFRGVSNDPATVYLVGARAGAIAFARRVTFAEGEQIKEVELVVADSTDDTSAVVPGESSLHLERGCSHLNVSESHELSNPTERVIFVPEGQREQRPPIFRAVLPERARGVVAMLGGFQQGLEIGDGAVTFWGPLYPGGQRVEFRYALPIDATHLELRRGFATGAGSVVVVADANGPRVRSPDLTSGAPREVGGRRHSTWHRRSLAAGEELALRVELPAAPRPHSDVAVREVQMWLELDDVALIVDEQLHFAVSRTTPLTADSDAPLLCLALPPGAEDLRLSTEAMSMGLAFDPSGEVAIRGPIPPGDSSLSLRFRLPVQGEPVVFEKTSWQSIPLLTAMVADTGILVDTDRLHRKRPFRHNGRSYIHLEGFGIEAGQTLRIELTRLRRKATLSPVATAGVAVLAAGAALAFLIAPLREGRATAQLVDEEAEAIATEREAVYAAIYGIDEDLATGKLSETDHAALRGELRARAVGLLARERSTRRETAAHADADEVRACPACNTPFAPDARFCSQCGARLAVGQGATE